MGATTPIYQLPYPAESDPADVPVDIKALCDRLEAVLPQTMPTGCGVDWFSPTAPSGFLLCDGSAVSRTTYSRLFAVIGTTWGAGDGSTTFNLPDTRGRIIVGFAASGGHTDVAALGNNEGSTLANRRPKHPHTFAGAAQNTGTVSADHAHYVSGNTGGRSAQHTHGVTASYVSGSDYQWSDYNGVNHFQNNVGGTAGETQEHTHAVGIWSGGISANHTHAITCAGTVGVAGTASDAPAYVVAAKIIKT